MIAIVGWCWGHHWFICLWWKPSLQVEWQSAQEIWWSKCNRVSWIVQWVICCVL